MDRGSSLVVGKNGGGCCEVEKEKRGNVLIKWATVSLPRSYLLHGVSEAFGGGWRLIKKMRTQHLNDRLFVLRKLVASVVMPISLNNWCWHVTFTVVPWSFVVHVEVLTVSWGSFSTSVSNGRISTSVRCYIRSAAVKITALLTLPAAGISVSPRLAADVLCRAARWEALWTVVSFTRADVWRAALSGKLLGCDI